MWEIAVVIAVIVFSITCFFVIRTLITLQRSILSMQGKIENLSEEATTALRLTEARLMLFDSTFRSLSNVGDICELKTAEWKAAAAAPPMKEKRIGEDIVRWALTSAELYQQLFKKKR